MSVIPAKLEDAISYSDFSQEVPLELVLVQDIFENRPDDDLVEGIRSANTTINETEVHIISNGNSFICHNSNRIIG